MNNVENFPKGTQVAIKGFEHNGAKLEVIGRRDIDNYLEIRPIGLPTWVRTTKDAAKFRGKPIPKGTPFLVNTHISEDRVVKF